ncbi:MAG: diphthine synthase [Candidatus Nanohaloarchaeota archaeon]|nr:diphthine synthase [Candidatus Nanohaloarchaeota archaeon]
MLWLVGVGVWEPKDMSIKAYDVLQNADEVYLEDYTAHTFINASTLSDYLGREVKALAREEVEDFSWLLEKAKNKNVALAVKGDVFAATTHYELYRSAVASGIRTKVVHGSSVFSAIGKIGLSLYKYGRVASLPHPNLFPSYPSSPFQIIQENLQAGMHTLVLLDIKMHLIDGLELISKHLDVSKLVGCYALGSDEEKIAYGSFRDLRSYFKNVGNYASCIVVPGKLEFYEEDALKLWNISD